MNASKIFAGAAGTMLLGAAIVAAQQPSEPNTPALVKNTASVTATDTGLSVALAHSACIADGRLLSVNFSGSLSLADPVTAEQAAALQKAWETSVEPVLDADVDPFLRTLNVTDILSGNIQGSAASTMSDEEVSAHVQNLQVAVQTFEMQALQALNGNTPDGLGGSIGAGYSISKTAVPVCNFQPAAPK